MVERDISFGTLTLAYRSGRQEMVELTRPVVDLGSAAENDVVVRDPFVDSHHAQLRCSERGIQVLDLGSPTGTLLDGIAVSPQSPMPLRDGAVIEIGRVSITYRAVVPAARGRKEKVKPPRRRKPGPASAARPRRLPRAPLFFLEALVIVVAAVILGGMLARPWLSGAAPPMVGGPPASTPLAVPTAVPAEQPVQQYVVATTAGRRLNVRAQPGQNAPVVGQLENGDVVRAVEGPVEADGFSWVRIEGEGVSGWSALEGLRPR